MWGGWHAPGVHPINSHFLWSSLIQFLLSWMIQSLAWKEWKSGRSFSSSCFIIVASPILAHWSSGLSMMKFSTWSSWMLVAHLLMYVNRPPKDYWWYQIGGWLRITYANLRGIRNLVGYALFLHHLGYKTIPLSFWAPAASAWFPPWTTVDRSNNLPSTNYSDFVPWTPNPAHDLFYAKITSDLFKWKCRLITNYHRYPSRYPLTHILHTLSMSIPQ